MITGPSVSPLVKFTHCGWESRTSTLLPGFTRPEKFMKMRFQEMGSH